MESAILVINAGSSSIKFQLIDSVSDQLYIKGIIEEIGSNDPRLVYELNNQKSRQSLQKGCSYPKALEAIASLLKENQLDQYLIGVGHRVVHGGEHFFHSVLIDDQVLKAIEECIDLAPLHNPANLEGIQFFRKRYPHIRQVAVFDTSFHQTLNRSAFLYAIPYKYYQTYKIRKYGFHGTSHHYVFEESLKNLKLPRTACRIITAHLGNGCSLCAIKDGKSVDTSMGMTPLEGLVMGKRSGNVDPSIIQYIMEKENVSAKETIDILNHQSGLLGISEVSSDMRELLELSEQGHEQAHLAIEIFCYRLAKMIAGYLVPLRGLDALVFTGGIGENAALVREITLKHLTFLGFEIDRARNQLHGKESNYTITQTSSQIPALVIPTNEEKMIAHETLNLIGEGAL